MFVCFINNVQQFSVVLTIVIAKTECYALAFQLNPFFYAQTIGFFIFYAQTIGFFIFYAQTIGFFIFYAQTKGFFLCANNRIFYAQTIGFFYAQTIVFFKLMQKVAKQIVDCQPCAQYIYQEHKESLVILPLYIYTIQYITQTNKLGRLASFSNYLKICGVWFDLPLLAFLLLVFSVSYT